MVRDCSLKDKFPRLFRIATDKSALVYKCFKIEGNHLWSVDFRCQLRSFELGSRDDLFTQLGEFPLSLGEADELVWTGDTSGTFSVKSMVGVVVNQLEPSSSIPTLRGKVLPHLGFRFMWCALRGKVSTRLDLKRRGLLKVEEDTNCPLCDFPEEDADHLFISCPFMRLLRLKFLNLFDTSGFSIELASG